MSIYAKKTALVDAKGNDIGQGKAFRLAPRTGSVQHSASTPLVGANGEYNANSTADLAEIADALVTLRQSGLIHSVPKTAATSDTEGEATRLVQAAYESRDAAAPAFRVLGEVITDEITETVGRVGFTSKVLGFKSVAEGTVAQIKIKQKDVVAWQVFDDGVTIESFVTGKFYQPKFYYLSTKIKFEEGTVHEWGSSLIQEKHDDGVEAIMTRDDNITRALLAAAAPVQNDLIAFNALTPNVFSEMINQVARWSIPVPHCLMAIDCWNDIRADQDWQRFYSPIEKHTLAEEGKLGKLMGVEIITDGFRYDTLRVLQTGEIFMLGMPGALGVRCERIPLTPKPLEFHLLGEMARGWLIFTYQATAVLNSRGVCRGTRV